MCLSRQRRRSSLATRGRRRGVAEAVAEAVEDVAAGVVEVAVAGDAAIPGAAVP